jgi:hypothetical protein
MAEDEIASVIERMEAIGAGLPEADGVARFNHLYLVVTRAVLRELRDRAFEDTAFLGRFDVVFAGLYLAAVDDDRAGRHVGDAWRPLFERRSRGRIAPVQFALAGMNAHINHDLCLALVATCEELGLGLDHGSPHHRDYLKVNATLERVEEEVKKRLATGLVGVADEALGRIDDVVARWKLARARDAAWVQAQTLSALQVVPGLANDFVLVLGRTVGLASRGLLIPTL